MFRAVLRLFADSGGPVSVAAVADSLAGTPLDTIARALAALSDDDLLVLRGDRVELAYPFSTAPTPFVVRRTDGRERYVCCAIDALGVAPMLAEHVEIASQCHHCAAPLCLGIDPQGPSSAAHDLMVWLTRPRREEGRACVYL